MELSPRDAYNYKRKLDSLLNNINLLNRQISQLKEDVSCCKSSQMVNYGKNMINLKETKLAKDMEELNKLERKHRII